MGLLYIPQILAIIFGAIGNKKAKHPWLTKVGIASYEVIERAPKTENSYRLLRVPDIIIKELELRRKLVDSNREQIQHC